MKFSFRLYPCRLTLINRPCVEILSRNAPHGKHAVRVADHARSHTGMRADPYAVLDDDVAHHQVKGGLLVIVVAAKQKSSRERQQWFPIETWPKLSIHTCSPIQQWVTDGELPRVFDGDARFENHTTTHFGTEEAQEGALEGTGPGEPGLKEQNWERPKRGPNRTRASQTLARR